MFNEKNYTSLALHIPMYTRVCVSEWSSLVLDQVVVGGVVYARWKSMTGWGCVLGWAEWGFILDIVCLLLVG